MSGRFLTRAWGSIERPVLAISLVVFHRWLGAGWNKNDWKKYMTQESASSVSAVAQRQGPSERLIDEIREKPADVHLLVALNPRRRGFEIVDGFHRAAILAACRPGSTVSCSLVSHIVA